MQTQDEKVERAAVQDIAAFGRPLEMLTERQIRQIDHALAESGPFAEVWLVKYKGRLRFIKKVDCLDAASR